MKRLFLIIMMMFLLIWATGCAHFRTANLKVLDKPDYYLGKIPEANAKIALLPIHIREWKMVYDKPLKATLDQLKDSINSYLKSASFPILPDIALPEKDFPVVYFGVAQSIDFPGDPEDPVLTGYNDSQKPLMVIYEEGASQKWKQEIKKLCSKRKLQYILVPFISIGDFKVYQKDWKGNKEIVLGTNYRVHVPWLTALDQPVEVLYISAALVDKEGKILRVGAEGLLAKRTNFAASIVNIQSTISSQDVQKILHTRREDLPGKPPVWKAAMEYLIKRLTQSEKK